MADCLFERVAHVSWCHSCRNLPSPGRNRRVEVARGLVADQQRRAVDHSAGNGHALLLATGKLVGQRVHLIGQTDQTQHLGHLAANDALGLANALQGKRHVFVGGFLRQELKVLEHGANLTAQERNLAVLDLHEVLAGDQNAAARGLDVAVERRQQRGLTRAGVTDQKDELARIDLDVDVVERGLVGLRRVDLGDVLHDDGLDTGLLGHLLAAGLRVDGRKHRREVGVVERVVKACDLGGLIALDHGRSRLRGVGDAGKKAGLRGLRRGSCRSHGVGDAGHGGLRCGSTRLRLSHAGGHRLNGLKARRAGKRNIVVGVVGKGICRRLCLICRLCGDRAKQLSALYFSSIAFAAHKKHGAPWIPVGRHEYQLHPNSSDGWSALSKRFPRPPQSGILQSL